MTEKNIERDFPEIKKIEQEGFEDNAAVVFGTKEEAERKKQVIEKEGYAENLGTYIRMHKEITVPADKILTEDKSELRTGMGIIDDIRGSGVTNMLFNLRFIDKEGNIATVRVDTEKIAELKDFYRPELSEWKYTMWGKLIKLGFSRFDFDPNVFYRSINQYSLELREQAEERKSAEFDF